MGQENYRTLSRIFYRNSHAALVVYDVSSRASFDSVQHHIDALRDPSNGAEQASIMLVGNKTDLTESRQVSTEEGAALARLHNVLFIETSARQFTGVNQAFEELMYKVDDSGVVQMLAEAKRKRDAESVTVGQGAEEEGQQGQGLCC